MGKNKYALIFKHKGIGIYVLKKTNLNKDNLGYVVDHEKLRNKSYPTIQDAIDTIDKLFKEEKCL